MKHFDNGSIVSQFSNNAKDYTYVSGGSFGCVFSGPFGSKKKLIIKISKQHKDAVDAGTHEAIMGNILHRSNFPAGRINWVQTVAYGRFTGGLPLFEAVAAAKGADECAKDMAKARVNRLIIIQEDAGETSLAGWLKENGRPRPEVIKKIAFQLVWAVYAAGAQYGVIHSDIKLVNIVVSPVKRKQTLQYAIRTKNNNADVFELNVDAGDVIVKLVDLGGSFIMLGGGGAGIKDKTSPFYDSTTFTKIYESPESASDNGYSVVSDLYAIGIVLLTLACENNAQVNGIQYSYKTFKQPPVPGKAITENTPAEVKNMPKNLLDNLSLVQEIILSTAIGSDTVLEKPFQALYNEWKKAGIDVLPALQTSVENGTSPLGLMFIQELLRINVDERQAFGIRRDEYGAGNALFHPYFEDYYSGVAPTSAESIVFELGHRKHLFFESSEEKERVKKMVLALEIPESETESVSESAVDDSELAAAILDILDNFSKKFPKRAVKQSVTVPEMKELIHWMHKFADILNTNQRLREEVAKHHPYTNPVGWVRKTEKGKEYVVKESIHLKRTKKVFKSDEAALTPFVGLNGYKIDFVAPGSSGEILGDGQDFYFSMMLHWLFMLVAYNVARGRAPNDKLKSLLSGELRDVIDKGIAQQQAKSLQTQAIIYRTFFDTLLRENANGSIEQLEHELEAISTLLEDPMTDEDIIAQKLSEVEHKMTQVMQESEQ